MKLIGILLTFLALVVPGNLFGQTTNSLPLSASNCAIAAALDIKLPRTCLSSDLGKVRGIVIRLNSELGQDDPTSQTKDIVISGTRTNEESKILPKNHAAAKSQNGYFIHFSFDSFDLEPEFKDHLARLASVLNGEALATSCLRVIGHTDSIGSNQYNQKLSHQRAVMVASYISEVGEINPTRIQIVGKGESELLPKMSGSDARNRRVEFATKDSTDGCAAT